MQEHGFPAPPPSSPRLGWIGVGVMGRSMAGRLLAAGFRLTVFSRRRESAAGLLERGAAWADSPRAVAAASDVVFTMVGHPADVRAVTLGPDGALAGLAAGGILVDHTTSAPVLAEEIAAVAAEHGVAALDAPVSGGDKGAREGTLTVMVGGDAAARERLAACWRVTAGTVVACGGPGAGQRTKLANQVAVASGMIAMCEALLYAHAAGLDLETTLRAITPGAAGSWAITTLAPRILRGDFAPGFMVEHIVKDMRIVLEECRRMGLALPGLTLAEAIYDRLVEQGGGRLGTQALVLALAQQSGIAWPRSPPPQPA